MTATDLIAAFVFFALPWLGAAVAASLVYAAVTERSPMRIFYGAFAAMLAAPSALLMVATLQLA